MGFSRQEYWSGLPFPSPENLPDPGIEPGSPALEADALPSEPPGKPDQESNPDQSLSPTLAGIFFTTEPPGTPWSKDLNPVSMFSKLHGKKKKSVGLSSFSQ